MDGDLHPFKRFVAPAGNEPFGSRTGTKDNGRLLVPGGTAGFALYGGYATLPPGRYTAAVWLAHAPTPIAGAGTIDVCAEFAGIVVATRRFDASAISAVAPFIEISFTLGRTLENVEIRIFGEAGFTATITSVELTRAGGLARAQRPLHILYVAHHMVLEFDEIRMLTDLGHKVFSLEGGAYHMPGAGNQFRPAPGRLFQPDDYARYMRMGLSAAFLAEFDAIIVMDQPRRVPMFCELAGDVPVIYRAIGQMSTEHEEMLFPYLDRIHVVRYTRREAGIPFAPPADDVIYFGKYASDYRAEWVGGGPVLSIMNGFVPRDAVSTPNLSQYAEIAESFPCELYGSENEGFRHALGVLPWDEVPAKMQHAGLFLMTCTAGPSYVLTVMEVLAAGVPMVAPTASFIEQNVPRAYRDFALFSRDRYEVPTLLHNDERMLFSSVAEAKAKIGWLLKNKKYCRMVSRRQQMTFSAMFAAERIMPQWEALLRRLTARLP